MSPVGEVQKTYSQREPPVERAEERICSTCGGEGKGMS